MHIVFVAVEAVPFAKVGGVADVIGCLPKELANLGHRVQVILPLHKQIDRTPLHLLKKQVEISFRGEQEFFSIWKGTLPESEVPILFLENEKYFDRDQIYGFYEDNAQRFALFSLAVLETILLLQIPCQVIHLHDWPTALIPAYFKIRYRNLRHFRNSSTLLTVHNLIYQGLFPREILKEIDLPEEFCDWREMESQGKINFLKIGLVFADRISTVSKTHAENIQQEEFGNGLDVVFRTRKEELSGIVNGVDYSIWNPVCDPYIPYNYTDMDLSGKHFCKQYLRERFQLEQKDQPVIAMITRLDHFKGVDLVTQILPQIIEDIGVQFVILGQGEPEYIDFFQALRDKYPKQVAVYFSHHEALAHIIEAGADMYLMPSYSEPCGLNQLYSMKYGTIPIVREIGGLADTVTDCTEISLNAETATGFSFKEFTKEALYVAIKRAVETYRNPILWTHLQYLMMQQDWSWGNRARDYVELYHGTLPKD